MSCKKQLFALALGAVMLLTACTSGNSVSQPPSAAESKSEPASGQSEAPSSESFDYFMKYDPAITMTVGQFVGDDKMFPEGETPENNKAYSMVRDNIGIDLQVKFTAPYGDTFNEKVRQMINTNDIPDFCTAQIADIETLIKGDMIEDLAPYIEKYGSPALKDMLYYNDGVLIEAVKRGDRIYGLPSAADINNGVAVLYIRKDYMEQVGASEPKSIEDVVDIAKKFMDAKLTKYGVAVSKEITGGNAALGYTGLMNAYKAYPGLMILGADGSIISGSIAPEMKTALDSLKVLYADGVIDKDFMTKDSNKVVEEILAGDVGVMVGEFWSPLWPLQTMITENPEIDWNTYHLPMAGGGQAQPMAKVPVSGYAFVRKGYEHPEAAVIMLNHMIDDMYSPDTTRPFATELRASRTDEKYKNLNIFSWLPLQVDRPDKNINWAKNLQAAVDAGSPDSLQTPDEIDLYDKIVSGTADNWCWARTYLDGVPTAGSYAKLRYADYNGSPTPTMLKQLGILDGIESEFVISYITGQNNDFDKFAAEWRQNGGDQILQEVNEAYAASK